MYLPDHENMITHTVHLFETLSNNVVLDFPLHTFLSETFSAEDKKIVQHGVECNVLFTGQKT